MQGKFGVVGNIIRFICDGTRHLANQRVCYREITLNVSRPTRIFLLIHASQSLI